MGLWVMSQDKTTLLKVYTVGADDNKIVVVDKCGRVYKIGEFIDNKRALEVIDDIVRFINTHN